jgi:hypothetical protein
LNTTDVFVDITGKDSLSMTYGVPAWNKTYGGTSYDYASSVVHTSDGGYVLAGYTSSYGAGGDDFWLVKTSSAGIVQWNKTYGGTSYDRASSVVQTSDGGYAIAGYTSSYGAGDYDFYLVKTNAAGTMQWNKTYGGTSDEYAYSVVQTGDGGYALAGGTYSYGAGIYDFWLVKTDAAGTMLWSKTYGGAYPDSASSVVQTSDGGYALAGYTYSYGAGSLDFWLVKTDSAGTLQWNKTYGGTSYDYASSVVHTSDGGYVLAGYTSSYGAGINDFWLVKTDSAGTLQWNKTYGGTSDEYANSVVQTGDGGYALAGSTYSYGAGSLDFWLVRTDLFGNALWNKTYGGANDDSAYSVVQTVDGGYAIAGSTYSFGVGVDFWLVKVKAETGFEHQRNLGRSGIPGTSPTYGGTNYDDAYSVVQTSDGGYAIAGTTESYDIGGGDFWLVKTDWAGNALWSKTYGGIGGDCAFSVVQTSDGGYALAGYTGSYGVGGDMWLVKTDSAGTMLWSKTYGGTSEDRASSVVQTSDGGYAIAGTTISYGVGGDFWLVKTDSAGAMQWNRPYGGTNWDYAYSVVQTSDGGYAITGYTKSYGVGTPTYENVYLVKTFADGTVAWNRTYGGTNYDGAYSVVQTVDGGYALAGSTSSYGAGRTDFWLVRTDLSGNALWNKTYGGAGWDEVYSMVQTGDGGYALAGGTRSCGAVTYDFWLVKTDGAGTLLWSKTYGGTAYDYTCWDYAYSVVQTVDGGYAIAGSTNSYGAGHHDFWLVKTDVESGLAMTSLTNQTVTLYRGRNDLDWNYVRVRIWLIKEPTWIYGDINMDGVVDAKDLYILGRNYGKTFSLLSLSGIIAVAGIRTVKKRKQAN